MAAAGFADGKVRLFYVTSERTMLDLDAADTKPVRALAIAPKDDGLVALEGGIRTWAIDPKHPEITLQTVFGKVWYEGYSEPQYMWQSSGGSEPRFSLMPLVIGTLKASFYSLLFGVPIALAAAVYTSEFMSPRSKSYLKPAIESMASLPSVVLGFLAGLVFAPYIETVVPAVLASILTIPLAFLGGAYLWQLVPEKITLRLDRWKFLFICLAVPIGLVAAAPVGALMESVLFGGDLRTWIDGKAGSGVGGWMFLLFPVGGLFVSAMMSRFATPLLRVRAASLGRSGAALLDALRFCVGFALTLFIVWLAALLFEGRGMDPRTGFMLGPYSQRNVLIVGFAMGFAIIPIVYTIAEDALSAVPEHLRAGSLAAGATRWQTATRIVIPTAMSGLFSAIMIGTGRAVGETMIVLMATGNTPVMDWSLFTGARTLSAAIAVQLPEEVRNSTAYRTLFLAALTLFAMTFVLNTLAEAVRLRFRKRSYQL
jgi:phosphate transport system permease protein